MKTMDSYKKFVSDLARTGENRVFLNSDEKHALPVLVQIFRNAQDTVRIFAHSLCRSVGQESEYIEALSEFIERGGNVMILLNDYDENLARRSNLFKRLAYYSMSREDSVIVKTTKSKPYLVDDPEKKEIHFTVGDVNSYRIEKDVNDRSAECNFNNPSIAGGIAKFFDELFSRAESTTVNLPGLFEK